jgi:serine/threonine-protein phosphatase 6 catalytic subunit
MVSIFDLVFFFDELLTPMLDDRGVPTKIRQCDSMEGSLSMFRLPESRCSTSSTQSIALIISAHTRSTFSQIIDGEVLCVHGGLSPDIRSLDQIRVIGRSQEIPHEGAFCDLMWSDPEDLPDSTGAWAVSPRGAGWLFGHSVTREFNHINNLKLIARAHQLVQEGWKYMFDDTLVTVWSAPNYCYRCGNMASILTVNEDGTREFKVYDAAEENESDTKMVAKRTMGAMPYFV